MSVAENFVKEPPAPVYLHERYAATAFFQTASPLFASQNSSTTTDRSQTLADGPIALDLILTSQIPAPNPETLQKILACAITPLEAGHLQVNWAMILRGPD